MKVFEVTSERDDEDGRIITHVEYVTCEKNTLQAVVDHFTKHCEEYDSDLKGVREVLTIVEHI